MASKTLYKWEALIDAEGRCENYWLKGYTAGTEYGMDAYRRTKKQLKEDGEKVLDLKMERAGFVYVEE